MTEKLFLAVLGGAAMIIGTSSVTFESGAPAHQVAMAKPKVKAKSLSRCVRYKQVRGGDEQSVEISLRNRCKADVSCSVQWKLSCDGDEVEPREFSENISLERGESDSLVASATVCGNAAWAIDDIRWDCSPL